MTDCKIMKTPEVYVGMQLERIQEGLLVHQENFANKTLVKYNMTNCKIMKTPEVYVGMQLERIQEGLFIHQENFANKTLSNRI